ncbi:unnamed protein product [Cyprideis torosa]|uniref:60S ribosomal protein L23 n=1 Tax=Cyprideis torosa TaxID=163714 RepID=A0A7R8W7A3_9CRUS|nr:unnamed protein product [Cyprideis torosa]CAG0884992.1 unnamed protein product [Cyprideis torosa]
MLSATRGCHLVSWVPGEENTGLGRNVFYFLPPTLGEDRKVTFFSFFYIFCPSSTFKAHPSDLVMIAVMGQKKKAVVVGSKQYLKIPMVPDFDTHNVVLLNNDYTPIGKRILAPVPHMLREKGQYAKVIAIATKFV